jgi:hypothetical protein
MNEMKQRTWPFWLFYVIFGLLGLAFLMPAVDSIGSMLLMTGLLIPVPIVLLGRIASRFKWKILTALLTILISWTTIYLMFR